jgi:Lipid A 3-O-deacylase (PagL)
MTACPLFSQIDGGTMNAADNIRTRTVMGLRGHAGSLLIHSQALSNLRRTYPWGLEADLARQYVDQKAWDFCNCYPRVGGALTFWDYGHRILGKGLTAVAYVEPVFLTRHRLNLSIRMGGGLAYSSNPFDSVDNPFNQAYSLRINVPLVVGVGVQFRLTPHWGVRLSAAFNHVSNGGLSLPNKGLNYPTLGLGVDYAPLGIDFKERAKRQDRRPPDPRLRLYVGGLGTIKNASGGRQPAVWGAWANGVYYLGRWSGLNLGLEWVDDGARRLKMDLENIPGHPGRGAVLVGHQFLLGRVVFSQQLGIYVFDQFKVNDPVYQRFGLGLHVTRRLYAGISLKTHRHVADLAEIRLGYGIWREPRGR